MWRAFLAAWILSCVLPVVAGAHVGMVIPSASVVAGQKDAMVSVTLSFSRPMEMTGVPLAIPKVFQVVHNGKTEDLKSVLRPVKVMGQNAWTAQYTVSRAGTYQFVMETSPCWEPAEDRFLIHYAKTCVAALGEEKGWDDPVGLMTEIVPLTRPFGAYAGSVFQGRVLLNGKPAPDIMVEVEFYNREKKYTAPNAAMFTYVVKADERGIFTCGIPFAGWWGFAAQSDVGRTIEYQGISKNVALGAVLWMEFVAPLRGK
jgi:cobalt/nickel transport protein